MRISENEALLTITNWYTHIKLWIFVSWFDQYLSQNIQKWRMPHNCSKS